MTLVSGTQALCESLGVGLSENESETVFIILYFPDQNRTQVASHEVHTEHNNFLFYASAPPSPGHGPFSHMFDGMFIPKARPDITWKVRNCDFSCSLPYESTGQHITLLRLQIS